MRLEATDGLPTFLIEAYFDAAIDSKPHVRPVTAAIVAARGKCFTRSGPPPETFSVLDVAVRDRKVTVTQPVGCLANAMNASAIDDPGTFAVSIVVRVGA